MAGHLNPLPLYLWGWKYRNGNTFVHTNERIARLNETQTYAYFLLATTSKGPWSFFILLWNNYSTNIITIVLFYIKHILAVLKMWSYHVLLAVALRAGWQGQHVRNEKSSMSERKRQAQGFWQPGCQFGFVNGLTEVALHHHCRPLWPSLIGEPILWVLLKMLTKRRFFKHYYLL